MNQYLSNLYVYFETCNSYTVKNKNPNPVEKKGSKNGTKLTKSQNHPLLVKQDTTTLITSSSSLFTVWLGYCFSRVLISEVQVVIQVCLVQEADQVIISKFKNFDSTFFIESKVHKRMIMKNELLLCLVQTITIRIQQLRFSVVLFGYC